MALQFIFHSRLIWVEYGSEVQRLKSGRKNFGQVCQNIIKYLTSARTENMIKVRLHRNFFRQKALFVYLFEENSPAPEENKETKVFA